MKMHEVRVAAHPSAAELAALVAEETPFVATGLIAGWEAISWTPERLAALHGDLSTCARLHARLFDGVPFEGECVY